MDLDQYANSAFGEPRRTPGRHGYVAYFPAPILRVVELPGRTIRLLADAEASLGRLAGVGQLVPNPYLLIRPYLLREALSSTRIEGTQASLADVFEAKATGEPPNPDVEEVLNYIDALEWGLGQLDNLPLGVRLIREMHRRLLAGVRGRERMPGEFRTTQNWVGAGGSTVTTAKFVPPPPDELASLLADWERYAHEDVEVPLLVKNALLHYQFETLHPFQDGNGRLGRLLSVFMLVEHGRLPAPLLYLSAYLERERDRYTKCCKPPARRATSCRGSSYFSHPCILKRPMRSGEHSALSSSASATELQHPTSYRARRCCWSTSSAKPRSFLREPWRRASASRDRPLSNCSASLRRWGCLKRETQVPEASGAIWHVS